MPGRTEDIISDCRLGYYLEVIGEEVDAGGRIPDSGVGEADGIGRGSPQ
jgi:hypothetical protein